MNTETQIGDIVASDYRSASVFRKYGIDFCCGGGKMLGAVCESKGLNPQQILSDLMALEKEAMPGDNYKEWSLSRLTDHIIEKHHLYTRSVITDLKHYLKKVARVHGDHNPELKRILSNFEWLAAELTDHMQKEELILFPYIKRMETCEEKGERLAPPSFGTIQNPIRMMESEHDTAGDYLKVINQLSNDYSLPEHACNTYIVSFKLLEEFERDLHKHIHLENNILFPRAIELEKELL